MEQRSYYFDNAKFILIGFVVFGHLLSPYANDSQLIGALYKTIYTFHMPAFILVSGYFAKGFYKKGYLAKIIKKLIIPYLIFQSIYTVFYYYLYGKSQFVMDVLNPHWSLWFLISLFCWNLLLLAFAKIPPAAGILLSVLIALAAGYADWISNYLSLSRTLVFFPMFLIGYHLTKGHIHKLLAPKVRLASLAIMAAVFIGFFILPDVNYKWLLGSKPYSEIETATAISMFKRLGFYILSLIMTFSFLSLIPRDQQFFTKWGTRTLYVYLLHGFFVRTFRESSLHEQINSAEGYLIMAAVSLAVTIVLSSRLVTSLTQPIIELKLTRTIALGKKALESIRVIRKRLGNLN